MIQANQEKILACRKDTQSYERKNKGTLMTNNPKNRPSPMRPGKKVAGHQYQTL
jgi:hypothetical protein